MATVTISYSADTAITISPASLATSATFVAGRESNEVDNTSNKYVDAFVQGFITVGTTPTANTQIIVFVWGADDPASTTALDVIDGVDSAETITNTGVLGSLFKVGGVINVLVNTSDIKYYVPPFSVAQLFGGIMPQYWGIYLSHNTGVNLNSTAGNHEMEYVGIKYDVA